MTTSTQRQDEAPQRQHLIHRRTILGFILPFLIPFILFYVAPIVYAIYQSFLRIVRTGGQYGQATTTFAGFYQYAQVLTNHAFWASLGRVGLFGIVQVPCMLALSLLIALLLDSRLVKGKAFFRLTAFLPYAVPGLIAAIIWSFLYHPQLSPIVALLGNIGVHADFLSGKVVLWSIANISTWLWTGYNMIIIYSSLQSVPQELYEAAEMDGAGNIAIATRIKIPLVMPSIFLTVVFSIIGTLQLYNEPSLLAQIAPSVSSTYTPNMMAYSITTGGDYYQSAAMSVVIALTTFVLSLFFMRRTGGRQDQ